VWSFFGDRHVKDLLISAATDLPDTDDETEEVDILFD
jgi:hypothetical protein